MDIATFETIHRFLERTEIPTLFAYVSILPSASTQEIDDVLSRRRRWAQGQQGNPRNRREALWFIKNYSKIQEILLQNRSEYIQFTRSKVSSFALKKLEAFIRGALVYGELTLLAEVSIANQAHRLNIPDENANRLLDDILRKAGLKRPEGLLDHYRTMDIQPDLPAEMLMLFYERRKMWVDRIEDPKKHRRTRKELEAAWLLLKDTERRDRYDNEYRKYYPEPSSLNTSTVVSSTNHADGHCPSV